MCHQWTPFGYEVSYLRETIITATDKQFDLANKPLVRFVVRLIGLPHFGAQLRAFLLCRLLDKFKGKQRFLDAGCGIGLNAFLLSRRGHQVVGVDNDATKLRYAKTMARNAKANNVSFQFMDITKMKFAKESFDNVLCFEVLEHIPDDNRAISQMTRVLKPGGTFLLSVPAKGIISKINQESKHHVREGYNLKELQHKLSTNGLRITKVIPIEHTPIGFLIRYLNDEVGRRSLLFVTLLFPLFLPLGILDTFLPTLIRPNNWIIVAKKR